MKKGIVFLFIVLASCSSDDNHGLVYHENGVAINGYDPVAYFEQGEPREGIKEVNSSYGGFIYYFTNSKNKVLFDEEPEKYLPLYGGWCAYAIADAATLMSPDPNLWKIQDGKLILFYDDWSSQFSKSLLEKWNSEPDLYKERAEINWPKIERAY